MVDIKRETVGEVKRGDKDNERDEAGAGKMRRRKLPLEATSAK